MQNCKVYTPMEPILSLVKNSLDNNTRYRYRELIGCLMYLIMTSRPYLRFSVNYLNRFQNFATDNHWQNVFFDI